MFKITVEEDGVASIQGFLSSIHVAKDDLDLPGSMITVFGAFVNTNYQKRGQEFGRKWQAVSEYTRNVREQRGQNPWAPPLRPGGTNWLYNTSAVALMKWPRQSPGRTFLDSGNYPGGRDSDGPTAMVVTSQPMHATIRMVGAKAGHMFDDTSKTNVGLMEYKRAAYGNRGGGAANRYGMGYIPARPFWGVNGRMLEVMSDAVAAAFIANWSDRAQKSTGKRVNSRADPLASFRWRAL